MIKSVGVCVPIYYREDKAAKSIESLLSTSFQDEIYKLAIQLHFGVNGSTPEFHRWLYADAIPRAQNRGFEVSFYDKWGKNLGKPKAVNEMVTHMERGCPPEYIVSFDSDIIILNSSWLLELVNAFESYEGPFRLGALCPEQLEACCHCLSNPKKYSWKIEKPSRKYSIRYAEGNHGIAGGVLFTSYQLWKSLGGYAAHRRYAADDGHYAQALWVQGKYYMAILDQVQIIHPGGDAALYNAWKRDIIKNDLKDQDIQDFKFTK